MLRRLLFPLFAAAVLALGAVSELSKRQTASADRASADASPAAAKAATASSDTAKAVAAATAFKASLSSSQQTALQFAFSSSKKQTGWSNLPTTLVPRVGVKVGDLTTAQKAKLTTLLKVMLSGQGYSDEEATRKADTYLAQQQSSGMGGANNLQYGEGLYYVAFYGTPSTTKKWTIQFGGHHYAIHLTYSGPAISNTPYFVGVEPRTTFTVDGKTYSPMADEAKNLFGAVQSLSTAQQATAKLSQSFDDVLVGPQKDGQFPTRQGITVASLTKAQQALVTKAIRSYVGDMPTAEANARVALYVKQYAQTKLAYSKGTDATATGDYVRLHGPRLWIELVVQNGIVLSGTHYHSIERDIKSDYGAGT